MNKYEPMHQSVTLPIVLFATKFLFCWQTMSNPLVKKPIPNHNDYCSWRPWFSQHNHCVCSTLFTVHSQHNEKPLVCFV